MEISFTKMQGLGNDFVVIDAISQSLTINTALIRQLADRHFGIGCDQVLLVEKPLLPETDFHYRIFNADGSEVEQCGNGARCFARFVFAKGLTQKTSIPVGTKAGRIVLQLQADQQVTVDMGAPEFDLAKIPFIPQETATDSLQHVLQIKNQIVKFGVLSMGNPHAVLLVDDVDTAPVDLLGPAICTHATFPRQTNVGFMQISNRKAIRLRVYERGAGETLACGTGACAAMVYGRRLKLLDDVVSVSLPGGSLKITWQGGESHVLMTGPAETVFEGKIAVNL